MNPFKKRVSLITPKNLKLQNKPFCFLLRMQSKHCQFNSVFNKKAILFLCTQLLQNIQKMWTFTSCL